MQAVNDGTTTDQPADAPGRGARDWHAPRLTLLGDVRALTEGGGQTSSDGGGDFTDLTS
jgi:hypothetical protein